MTSLQHLAHQQTHLASFQHSEKQQKLKIRASAFLTVPIASELVILAVGVMVPLWTRVVLWSAVMMVLAAAVGMTAFPSAMLHIAKPAL